MKTTVQMLSNEIFKAYISKKVFKINYFFRNREMYSNLFSKK